MPTPTRLSPEQAAAIALPQGRLSAEVFNADGIEVRFYAPTGTDPQTPHDRDEFYFVISGTGTFERNGETVSFGPGDMLFAAAGEQHRFASFTPGFATWVLFYGPKRQ
jgi:mannose-6-phosphate isomerase-like protein (cupin superfamily)